MKKIFIFLFDGFSDWEIAFLTPEIRKSNDFQIVYFSKDGKPVSSMGGLRVSPETSLTAIHPGDVEMLILPGGKAWEKGENDFMDTFVKSVFNNGKTVAAICAATAFLGNNGFLNELKNTPATICTT